MRYLVVFFWTFALGQVVGYIGGPLSGGSSDFKKKTILSLEPAVIILLIAHFAVPKETKPVK